MARPGQVVHRSALLSAVWSDTSRAHYTAVDRLLRRLRRRLEPSPVSLTRIHRIGEAGYLFGSRANAR
jgi:DNA-binding response OmpR family regulator